MDVVAMLLGEGFSEPVFDNLKELVVCFSIALYKNGTYIHNYLADKLIMYFILILEQMFIKITFKFLRFTRNFIHTVKKKLPPGHNKTSACVPT